MAKKGARKTGKARKRLPKNLRPLNTVQKIQVKGIVEGQAEKKNVYFYQSFNDGTVTTRPTGAYVNRGWAIQNQGIRTNNTDILQLIPYVDQGDDVNQRIGRKIDPTRLTLTGSVRVSLARLNGSPTPLTNLKVYLFIMQHVLIKDYYTLYGQNDFSQFLYNGEGKTVYFNGEEQNVGQQVNSSVYKILKRVCVPLKFAGNLAGSTAGIPNSHVWKANYQMDLTKHLPAKLLYPWLQLEVHYLLRKLVHLPIQVCLCVWGLPQTSTRPIRQVLSSRPYLGLSRRTSRRCPTQILK